MNFTKSKVPEILFYMPASNDGTIEQADSVHQAITNDVSYKAE